MIYGSPRRTLDDFAHDRHPAMSFDFLTHHPVTPLQPYVQTIWYARGQVPYRRERILPTGTIVLLINLGAPFRLTVGAGPGAVRVQADSWVCGLQSRFMVNQPLGETHMVGVTFRPGAAYPFLGMPLRLIADDLIETEVLWQQDVGELRARLQETVDIDQRFTIVEQALLARLAEPPGHLAAVRWAAERLTGDGSPAVSSVAEALGISHKHLISLFGTYVGHPPKTLARVARFNRTLGALRPGRGACWEQTALACGYYDQAHFNRDFRDFSGFTPSTYLALRAPYHEDGLTPGQDTNFVPLS